MAPALADDFAEIAAATRFYYSDVGSKTLVTYAEEKKFYEEKLLFADSLFLKVFSFPLTKGDPRTALNQPYSIVITEEVSLKYFGQEDPMGRILKLDDSDAYKVTGVLAAIPQNSHIQFDFLASYASLHRWEDLHK